MLVVGNSHREIDEAVRRVLVLLLLAGPAALAATAFGGWWLARKALRPVDAMTSQAEEISIEHLHERIPVPRAADEVGRLAVTLNAMLERLEHGVEEKHRLLADASHELRTPLAVMRTEIDVSLRTDELPEAARALLESTRDEVDRMSRTVNNLLTLAQVDEGRLALLLEPLDLRDAVDAATRPLAPLAAAKPVRLTVGGHARVERGRPDPAAAGVRQLHRQRHQVHGARRGGPGDRVGGRRRGRGHRDRRRARHPGRRQRPRVRPLLPRRRWP